MLTDVSLHELARVSGDRIAEGIDRVRRGDISIEPGYDGRYGIVTHISHINPAGRAVLSNRTT